MRAYLRAALIACVLLFPFHPNGEAADKLRGPVALGKIPSGELYALDLYGLVYRLSASGGKLALAGSFRLPPSSLPIDLKAVKLLGQPALFVTSLNQKLAFVSQYSPDGQIQHTWTFLFPMTGLDVDLTSNIVYFARGNAPQVYELNLQSPNAKLVLQGKWRAQNTSGLWPWM